MTLLALPGCGGSLADADAFSGNWEGTSTVRMAAGEPVPSWLDNTVLPYPTASVSISPGVAPTIGYLCGGGQGPQAAVTGGSALTLSKYACPAGGVNRATVSMVIEGGSGVLSQGVLTLTVNYLVTYSGQDYPVTFVLQANRVCSGGNCPPLAG